MKRKYGDLGADYIDPFEIETTFSVQYSPQQVSKEQQKVEVELLVNLLGARVWAKLQNPKTR